MYVCVSTDDAHITPVLTLRKMSGCFDLLMAKEYQQRNSS